jgi:DNA-binding transcriptional regulator YiaG
MEPASSPSQRAFQSKQGERSCGKKRSQEKRITRQCQVIRFMRVSRRISQRKAAIGCRISEQAIGHYENGRMDIAPARLERFLKLYGYSRAEFSEYLNGKARRPRSGWQAIARKGAITRSD